MDLFRLEPDMIGLLRGLSDEELQAFAELQADTMSDAQVELHIYVCFLLFKRTKSVEHLEQAAHRAEGWLAITPNEHLDRPRRFEIHDTMFSTMLQQDQTMEDFNVTATVISNSDQFRRLSEEDLDQAINLANTVVDGMSRDHTERRATLSHLAILLDRRFELARATDDLDRAIEVSDMAVNATPQDHPNRGAMLSNLGVRLGTRFDYTGDIDDLTRAIDVAGMAVDATPQDHPNRARHLSNLGNRLGTRFDRTGDTNDLNRAIEVTEMTAKASSQDHPDRSAMLSNHGIWLGARFNRAGDLEDLSRAIAITETAINTMLQDDPMQARYLNNLSVWLGTRFDRTGDMDDLNRAIDVTEKAVAATPQDHPDLAGMLSNLGKRLGTRFDHTGAMEDLTRAISVVKTAVNATPKSHPDRALYLNNLGNWLGSCFDRTGAMDKLTEAIKVTEMAVNATPQDHPDRAGRLGNLGNWLGSCFDRTGAMDKLTEAIEVTEMAVNATPQDHPDRAGRLSNLGSKLATRFDRKGDMNDLSRAIEVTHMAINATPQDHPDRAIMLSNLGNKLATRFNRTGAMNDLNRAIEVTEMAVNATPQDQPDRAGRLSNLGSKLATRFDRKGDMNDLSRAIEVTNMAVNATPQDHPDRAIMLSNLGNMLGTRSNRIGAINDLNRAIGVTEMAVNATPQDHPNRACHLSNLGSKLVARFNRNGDMNDLNRAIEVTNMAVNATPQDHPDRAGRLSNLGHIVDARFRHTNAPTDLELSVSSFRQGWECRHAQPSLRIKLARMVARHLAMQSDWEQATSLLDEAVHLLPQVSLRSLQHTDKQHMLADFAGLASMAAAAALNAGKKACDALELLELGRGVIAGLLLEIRTDVSELEQQHYDLAKEFMILRDELDSPMDVESPRPVLTSPSSSSASSAGTERRWAAEKRLQNLLSQIRSKHGFHNFLLPPAEAELRNAAACGPIVVINVSAYRCDAFLVRQHYPVVALQLHDLHLYEIESHVRAFRFADTHQVHQTLTWLWNAAAGPILDALGLTQLPTDNNWPHLWWIPTGPLGQLPLHAAGRHLERLANTVLDRAMSSYSPSIKALVYGRRCRNKVDAPKTLKSALLVAVPDAGLPFAERELAMLEKMCPDLGYAAVKPAAHQDDILTHLRACDIFHFASHGRSNPFEPSESCLILSHGQSITVADLRDCRLQETSPFLAYLSACSTKVNEADRLVDEEVHLVNACQLAGFRHVVGTLWEVSDEHCVVVAETLYQNIRDEGATDAAVCRGLHQAIRQLRDEDMVRAQPDGSSAAVDVVISGDELRDRRSSYHGEDESLTVVARDSDAPRQSIWATEGGWSRLGGPRIWAAYIHVGV
ncbi:hypothetical protein Q7P36_010816 [Cladosporium allicinum]